MGGYKGMRSYFPIPPRLWNLLSNIRATPPAPLTVLSDAQLPYFQCLQPVVLIELKFLYHIARPAVIIYMVCSMWFSNRIMAGYLGNLVTYVDVGCY
ncbi:hypothetical protein CK203_014734 [Vitis vinifera]|uniref:Uncharacterized protein n=1 Tax=Vitis vinifera TaxID=29760 RepID=A0A438JGA8_VITVI|nr:hypothetical protein CK203_014734 [Vitis vinifera]